MKNKIILLIYFLIVSLTCSGCWNYHELSDFSIVTGIGIDLKDDKYKVSMIIANANNLNSGTKEGNGISTVVSGIGENITEAVNDIESKVPKDIYTGHLSLLIINEEVAKKGIYEILDSYVRNPESINKIYLVISKNTKSENILKTLSPMDSSASQNIISNLQNTKASIGNTTDIIVSEFISNILSNEIDNTITTVELTTNENNADNIDDLKNTEVKTEIKLSNLALFKKYKLVNYLNKEESIGVNVINNKTKSFELKSSCYLDDSKYIITKLDNPKSSIKVDIKNNKLNINIDIKASGSINETNCKLDLYSENTIKNINNTVKSDIYKMIKNTINKLKSNNVDVFGIANKLYKEKPNVYEKIENNWDDYYLNSNFNINIDINLKTKGSLENTIEEADYNEKS